MCLVLSLLWPAFAACASTSAGFPAQRLAELALADAPLALDVRTGVPADLTVTQIAAARGDAFEAFDRGKTYDSDRRGVLWLRFRLQLDEPLQEGRWRLEISKPFVESVEFHWTDAQGNSQKQTAGDSLAHRTWPVRALTPQFDLPALAAGAHTFYLRVQTDIPLHFSVDLKPRQVIEARDMHNLLTTGFVLSLLVFMVALSAILALVYKRWAYGWYSLFAITNFFAVAGYMGVSSFLFWPEAVWWPEYSTLVPTMLSTIVQLQFSRSMFVTEARNTGLHRWIDSALAFNLVVSVAVLLTPDAMVRQIEYLWVINSSVLLILVVVLRAWRQGVWLAAVWLLAYLPLAFVLGVAIVEHFGIWPVNQMPYLLPVYAIAYELPILLLVMLWHSKTRLAYAIRETTLSSADPLKGYVQSTAFSDTAENLWNEARRQQKDLGVAYVKVVRDKELSTLVNTYDPDRERAQWVRILRTVMREGDTLAQVDHDVFALFFKGQSADDDFSSRLIRLVALGLMAPQDHGAQQPIHFRVIACTRGTAQGVNGGNATNWATLDRAMQTRLHAQRGWSRRSIRLLGSGQVKPVVSDELHSDAWAQALDAQLTDERKPA